MAPPPGMPAPRFANRGFIATIKSGAALGDYPFLASDRSAADAEVRKAFAGSFALYEKRGVPVEFRFRECPAGATGRYIAFARSVVDQPSGAMGCGSDTPQQAAEIAWQTCQAENVCRRGGSGTELTLIVASRNSPLNIGGAMSVRRVDEGREATWIFPTNIAEGWICAWSGINLQLAVDQPFNRAGGARQENFQFNCQSSRPR
jgi:hypothetical protein